MITAYFKKHRHLFEWIRMFASYSAVQIVVQGLSFLAGIQVVWALPEEDYGYFVIVNAIVPIIAMLSDTGITSSLSAIGGKFWQDDEQMGSLLKTAMILRRQLVIVSALSITPLLVWMLWRSHASPMAIGCLIPIALAGVFFQLNSGVLSVVISLRQQVRRMQLLALFGVVPRLLLVALFACLGILNAPLTVAIGTFVLACQYWLLKQWIKPQISWDQPPNAEFRRDILTIVKRQAPLTVYFCLQGQIGIWLITIFGNVKRVAEVGALGRIGMIFAILISTTSALVLPRFARCQDPARLRSIYLRILLAFAGIVLIGTILSLCVPGPLLWLLGPRYNQLGSLVWLAVLATGTGSLSGVLYSLNVNKGWIPPAAIVIPAEIMTQVILCSLFDLSSVRSILFIGLLAPIVPGIINLCFGLRQLDSLLRLKAAPV